MSILYDAPCSDFKYASTWAIKCDGDEECYDGSDELGCNTKLETLIIISSGMLIMLFLTFFLYSHNFITYTITYTISKNQITPTQRQTPKLFKLWLGCHLSPSNCNTTPTSKSATTSQVLNYYQMTISK